MQNQLFSSGNPTKVCLLLIRLVVTNFLAFNTFALEKTIYGQDDRVDYFAADSFHQELAKSTAAMIRKTRVHTIGKTSYIQGPTLEDKGICKSERFSE